MVSNMKISIYIRVSTKDQVREAYSLEVQREYLEAFASCEGYEIYKVYYDEFQERGQRLLLLRD